IESLDSLQTGCSTVGGPDSGPGWELPRGATVEDSCSASGKPNSSQELGDGYSTIPEAAG
ncbi:MAG: hypothetical protein V3W14_09345, partial [Candidatus Neomarinimicrobiota bacterium]